jgi:methylmalonyl-CoA mutase
MLFFCINSSDAMSMNEMLNTTFPILTNQDWEKKAEESLKGKPVSTLSNDTYEQIKLKPLYSKEDQQPENLSQYP